MNRICVGISLMVRPAFPEKLKGLLGDPDVVKAGVGIQSELVRSFCVPQSRIPRCCRFLARAVTGVAHSAGT